MAGDLEALTGGEGRSAGRGFGWEEGELRQAPSFRRGDTGGVRPAQSLGVRAEGVGGGRGQKRPSGLPTPTILPLPALTLLALTLPALTLPALLTLLASLALLALSIGLPTLFGLLAMDRARRP